MTSNYCELHTITIINFRQSQDMQTMVQNLGLVYTDVQVNDLAQSHFENIEVSANKMPLSTLSVCKHYDEYRIDD